MSGLHSSTTEGGWINKGVNWASQDGLLPKIATLSAPVITSIAGTIFMAKALPKMNNVLRRVTGNAPIPTSVGGGVDPTLQPNTPAGFKTSKVKWFYQENHIQRTQIKYILNMQMEPQDFQQQRMVEDIGI